MKRHFKDWVAAYCEYASYTEAPHRMHFWSAISALAGAVRRGAWVDMVYFTWFPNHYIILVAPPGVVSKSTTFKSAQELLQAIPGINFGPNAVTGPKLIDDFSGVKEQFLIGQDYHEQAALTITASEMGTLLDPGDRVLVDWLVDLWDCHTGAVTKGTRGTGTVTFNNPFLNIITATTPSWLEGNLPEHMIGGGFTSRCIFVYAEEKEKLVAYPHLVVPKDHEIVKAKLISDLKHIAENVRGPFSFTPQALDFGIQWYEDHYKNPPSHLLDKRFRGYLARKQTHLHKLAMLLAISARDELVLTEEDLVLAHYKLRELERDLPKVFANIGRSEDSMQADRLLDYIKSRGAGLPFADAYQYVHAHFPSAADFEDIVLGLSKAGLIEIRQTPAGIWLQVKGGQPANSTDVKPTSFLDRTTTEALC